MAAFDATTAGIKIGWILTPDSEIHLSYAQYLQKAGYLQHAMGTQAELTTIPVLDAKISQ